VRAFLSAFGGAGHVFPMLALAKRLRERGNEVWFHSIEAWREPAGELDLRFVSAPPYIAMRKPLPGMPARPNLADAVRPLVPVVRDLSPDVIVNDFFYVPASMAGELAGIKLATLIPHPYPVNAPGQPYFLVGLVPPRTPFGAAMWRLSRPWFARRGRKDRRELNFARGQLGLPLQRRLYGGVAQGLAMVGTFPQLEYPRRWPSHVHVVGPMLFELPRPETPLPPGDAPLVLVAGSTAQDRELKLVRTAIRAFAGEPVRVLVSLNRDGSQWTEPLPDNVVVVEWASYSQVLPQASAIVCNGGHGTVVRALSEGVPLVVCPAGGDMGENGARVAWSGSGVMVPRALRKPGPLRLATRRVLSDARFHERAAAMASWARQNDGSEQAAELLERYAQAD
jgi:UDP:flavonoid glycosyltransferase YjiC (YdhE family)